MQTALRFLPVILAVQGLACASATDGRRPAVEATVPDSARALLGPMVGHTTDRAVTFWIQTDRPGRLEATVRDFDGHEEEGESRLTAEAGAMGTVRVDGLDSGTRYQASFELDDRPVATTRVEFTTFPEPGEATRLRIALVSCARVQWDSVQTIWERVHEDRPDVVLWLGDNNYLEERGDTLPNDWEDPGRMASKYAELRGLPALRPLLGSAIHYAIWDDHDYADGEPDRTFPLKQEVSRVFERFWANPSYGGSGIDGVYSRFTAGDVEVFLLDDRYWRDPEDTPDGPDKTMLGATQLRWFLDALSASDAKLKIVAIGVQVLADYHTYDGYLKYVRERERILDWIAAERIDGVVFVSGDRHLSELMRSTEREGYPLYELTASPIANRVFVDGLEQPNPIRIGGYSAGYNYGLLDVDTGAGTLVFRLKDAHGREVLAHEVALETLRFPAADAR